MLDLLLVYFVGRFFGQQARKKGYSFAKYFWRTILLFVLGEMVGSMMVVLILKRKGIEILDPQQAVEAMSSNILLYVLVLMMGIGGLLLVKRQVDQLPALPPTDPQA